MLPINGSIVIIDDRIEEAIPLFQFFSKQGCPYHYYSGEMVAFPNSLVNYGARIVILDYNLNPAITNVQTIKSQHHAILNKIINKNNGPYFLFLWSKNTSDYKDYKEMLESINTPENIHLKPLDFKKIEKSEFFELKDGNYEFKESKSIDLEKLILEKIEDLTLLKYFVSWENTLLKTERNTLSEAISITLNSSISTSSPDYSKYLISVLAKPFLEKRLKGSTSQSRIFASFNSLNRVFNSLLDLEFEEISNSLPSIVIENNYDVKSSDIKIEKLNSWFNINALRNDSKKGKIIRPKEFNFSSVNLLIKNEQRSNGFMLSDLINEVNNQNKYYKEIILEVSPDCDIAQNKRYFYRIVPGFVISIELLKKLCINAEFKLNIKDDQIISQPECIFSGPVFEYKSEKVMFFLDLSQISSIPITDTVFFKDEEYLFSLNNELLTTIKYKISAIIQKQGYQVLTQHI